METNNKHSTENETLFLSGLATVDLEHKRLESLVIPSSQIELEFADGRYSIKQYGLEKKIELKK